MKDVIHEWTSPGVCNFAFLDFWGLYLELNGNSLPVAVYVSEESNLLNYQKLANGMEFFCYWKLLFGLFSSSLDFSSSVLSSLLQNSLDRLQMYYGLFPSYSRLYLAN